MADSASIARQALKAEPQFVTTAKLGRSGSGATSGGGSSSSGGGGGDLRVLAVEGEQLSVVHCRPPHRVDNTLHVLHILSLLYSDKARGGGGGKQRRSERLRLRRCASG